MSEFKRGSKQDENFREYIVPFNNDSMYLMSRRGDKMLWRSFINGIQTHVDLSVLPCRTIGRQRVFYPGVAFRCERCEAFGLMDPDQFALVKGIVNSILASLAMSFMCVIAEFGYCGGKRELAGFSTVSWPIRHSERNGKAG